MLDKKIESYKDYHIVSFFFILLDLSGRIITREQYKILKNKLKKYDYILKDLKFKLNKNSVMLNILKFIYFIKLSYLLKFLKICKLLKR